MLEGGDCGAPVGGMPKAEAGRAWKEARSFLVLRPAALLSVLAGRSTLGRTLSFSGVLPKHAGGFLYGC